MINVVNYVHFYIDLHLYSIYILEEQPPVESEPFSEMLCDGARTWGILCGFAIINNHIFRSRRIRNILAQDQGFREYHPP